MDAFWRTNDPRIDDEHDSLNGTLRALKAVIFYCTDRAILTEAISVVRERLRIHFVTEESLAARYDREASVILAEDHALLLGMVDRLRALVGAPRPQREIALKELIDALAKHDREVDVPLFRLFGARA